MAKTFAYDDFGRMTSSTDELGNTTSIEADAAGLWLRIIEPDGARRSAERDVRGQVVAITDALGAVERFTWNGEGRRTSRSYADGGVESWQWDPMGNLIRYVDQAGKTDRARHRPVPPGCGPRRSRWFTPPVRLRHRAAVPCGAQPARSVVGYRYDELEIWSASPTSTAVPCPTSTMLPAA